MMWRFLDVFSLPFLWALPESFMDSMIEEGLILNLAAIRILPTIRETIFILRYPVYHQSNTHPGLYSFPRRTTSISINR